MGAGIKEQFGSNPYYDKFHKITGTVAFAAFPGTPAKLFRIKADPANGGVFFVGAVVEGVGRFPMAAGDDTGWNPSGGGGDTQSAGYMDVLGASNISGSMDYLYLWIKD